MQEVLELVAAAHVADCDEAGIRSIMLTSMAHGDALQMMRKLASPSTLDGLPPSCGQQNRARSTSWSSTP